MKRNENLDTKSIKKIHDSLAALIKEVGYDSINVSDIIRKSQVSRSTFYSYYKSKDDVPDKLIGHIFSHVFSSGLSKEEGHDFSKASVLDYKHIIEHLFYHFREERELIGQIFLSSASHRFVNSLSVELSKLVRVLVLQDLLPKKEMPLDLLVSQYVLGLIGLLREYTIEERTESPEEMTGYFFSLYEVKI